MPKAKWAGVNCSVCGTKFPQGRTVSVQLISALALVLCFQCIRDIHAFGEQSQAELGEEDSNG